MGGAVAIARKDESRLADLGRSAEGTFFALDSGRSRHPLPPTGLRSAARIMDDFLLRRIKNEGTFERTRRLRSAGRNQKPAIPCKSLIQEMVGEAGIEPATPRV